MNDELYHYGVKGMRWGVRRYRNNDGTYTDAGKRRNFKSIEKAYRKDVRDGFKNYRSGKTYRALARKNPDMADILEPVIKAEQKLLRARQKDDKLWKKEYDKLAKEYAKKHGRYPDGKDDHVLSSKASRKVGTPNWDAQIESHRAAGRDAVDKVLGEYGGKRLNTFNKTYGGSVLRNYVTKEAQLRNSEEDERNKR